MQLEPDEPVRQHPLRPLLHLRDSRRQVVEPNPLRNASDVFKHPLQPLQQALLVLGAKHLRVPVVRVRERHRQRISLPVLPLPVMVLELPEVRLCVCLRLCQRHIPLRDRLHQLLLLAHIPLYTAVGTRVPLLIPQAVVDPLRRVPLLSGNLPVRFQPCVNRRDVVLQHRIALRLHFPALLLVPVLLPGIPLNSPVVVPGHPRDFVQALPLFLVQVLDVLLFYHIQHLCSLLHHS